MRNKVFYIAGLILAIISVVGLAQGYVGDAPKVVVEGDYIEAPETAVGGEEMMIGAGTSHFRSSIQTDGDITVTDDATIGDDLTVGGDLTLTGGLTTGKTVQGGGSKTEYSSTTSLTLTNADICTYSILPIQPIASMNVTLPATSTITSCLTTAGQMMEMVIENTATTTNNLTIVAGTGMDLQEPDGQDVVIGQNNFAWLKFIKQADGNVVVSVDETIPAD